MSNYRGSVFSLVRYGQYMKIGSLKMNLQSLKSRVNKQKGRLIKGKSTKIAAAFMQNKANFKNNKIGVNYFETSIYKILSTLWSKKQTQFKPNTNPIPVRTKMNIRNAIKMNYKDFVPMASKKQSRFKPNTNPILSIPQFENGNFLRLKAIYPILYGCLSNICNQLDYLKCVEGGNYEFRKMSLKVQL